MSDSLATVTAYWRREDAAVAQDALEHAGIDALVEETSVAKVRVDQVEAVRAGDVLNRTCDSLDEVFEADEETRALICPACGSSSLKASMRGRVFAGIAGIVITLAIAVQQSLAAFCVLFAAAVHLLIAQRWRCEDCSATFD